MNRSSPEIENLVPQISPTHFTKEKSARELDLDSYSLGNMMELNGSWKIVGWAFADDVAPRDLCKYVILCERDGCQMWCHISYYSLDKIAEKIQRDPSKITSVR